MERVLIDRARAALRAGQAQRARQVLRRHAKRFPRGFLAEERQSLVVRVLVKMGRRDLARKKAKRFLKRYPKSLQRRRVERALKGTAP